MCVRIACLVMCLLVVRDPLSAEQSLQVEGVVLVPSVPTAELRLAKGETHTHRAQLAAGSWRLVLEQRDVDTVARFVLPGGVERGPFNSPAGRRGAEAFLVTLERPGLLRIVVRSRSRSVSGHYRMMIERLASAVSAQRSAAERSHVQAVTASTTAARFYADGAKAQAREHYRHALASWPSRDVAGRARTLVALALLARSNDALAEAADFFRRGLAAWRLVGHRDSEATTLNRLGLTLDKLGDSLAARRCFEQALVIWRALEDRGGEALVRLNLCLVLQRQGAFEEARDCYRAGLELVRELKQANRETVVLSNLAGVFWKLGEPDRALALYDDVLRRSEAQGAEARRGRVLSNRALLYYELGEAEQALLDHGEALSLFRRLEARGLEATSLSHLGTTHLDLGDLDRARTYLEQALALQQRTGDQRGAAATWRGLGRTYGRQEAWPKAFDAYAEALTLSRSLEDRRGEATLLTLLGQAHLRVGRSRRAVSELERAIAMHRQLGDRRQAAQAVLALGRARHSLGELDRASDSFIEARAAFRTVRDRAQEVWALEATARLERDRGRLPAALAAIETAVGLLEDLRTTVGGLRQRASFLGARRGVYELNIDLLMARHLEQPDAGYDRQAFAVSERARSRALLDLIRADTKLDRDLRRRVRAATRSLAVRTERQMAVLARAHEPAEATAADRAVVTALATLEAVRAEARLGSPDYARLVDGDTAGVEDVAALLDPGTLLLEYALGEGRSFLWAIGPASFASYALPGRETIEGLARQAHADLSTLDLRTGRTSPKALEALGTMLLGPVVARIDRARRLVVVPDGALHYLPFAALPRPDRPEPVVMRHEVVHLPSASTLAGQRRRVLRPATKTIAVLADPVFDRNDPRLPITRPSQPDQAPPVEGPGPRLRSAVAGLGRLPATGREAIAITDLVASAEERLVALGPDAHRERVLGGELADYRFLHFATHGSINTRHPELSGLVLATYDKHGRQRNGFLSMDDVHGLDLRAEMVVLSGCQTALGREIRGEGLLGLTHGFMVAGVPRLAASLWSVQDEATAQLMAHFYRGVLTEGKPAAAALAAAQRAIREQRSRSDPYFWSAFVLVGDWR